MSCTARILLISVLLAGCGDDPEPGSAEAEPDLGTDDVVPMGPVPPAPEGSWSSRSRGPGNTRHAVDETLISPDTVGSLIEWWEIDGLPRGMTSSPQVRDGKVYFGYWGGNVHAVEADTGESLWRHRVRCADLSSTLLVTEDAVFAACGSLLTKLDRQRGVELWDTTLHTMQHGYIQSSPKPAGDFIIIGVANVQESVTTEVLGGHGLIVAVHAETGAVEWELDLSGEGDGTSVWSSAAVDEERKLMFIGTGQSFSAPASEYSDSVVAIDYETGEVAWGTQYTANDIYTTAGAGPGPDFDVGAEPNLFTLDGQDVVSAGSKGGIFKVLDRDTGEEVWSQVLGSGSTLGGVHATAAVDDELDRIYVTNNNFTVYGFASGEHATADFAELFAIDAAAGGSILWSARLNAPCLGGAVTLANGVVFSTTIRGTVYAHDAQSGDKLWQEDMGHDQAVAVTVVDGWIFTGSGMEFLGAPIQAAGGNVKAFAVQ